MNSVNSPFLTQHPVQRARLFAGMLLTAFLLCTLAPAAVAQTSLSTLHDSTKAATDAANPIGDFSSDSKGVLYGVTSSFSTPARIYSMTPPALLGGSWTLKVLYVANNSGLVRGHLQSVILGKKGQLYGGSNNCVGGTGGCIFQLTPPATSGGAWTIQIIHLMGVSDGGLVQPGLGRLALDAAGNLYGVAQGGTGAVFELSPPATAGGAWTEKTLHLFQQAPGQIYSPRQNVVLDSQGNLYGTTRNSETSRGSSTGSGPLFKLAPPAVAGGSWVLTVLSQVPIGDQYFQPSISQLTVDKSGALYGVLYTITPFVVTPATWAVTYPPANPIKFGNTPPSIGRELAVDAKGNLYGADQDSQEVYKLTPPATAGGAWTRTVLHTFVGGSEGSQPSGRPLVDASGNVFGTTLSGGTGTGCKVSGVAVAGCGTVFELQ